MASGDTITKIADVIVPERFTPYITEKSTNVNAFFRSGAVSTLDNLGFSDGGEVVNMPFFKALNERAQLLDDTQDLEVKKIRSGKDRAAQHRRALVYGATDLAAALAGADPMAVVGDGIAENWSMEFNHVLLASLVGAMGALAAESPTLNTLDITGLSPADASIISGRSFIDALQTLGDAKESIAAIAVHSATDASLAKQGLIETIRDADGNPVVRTFMGKAVIIDDILAPSESGDDFTSYLFGTGAIGFGETPAKVPTEIERQALKNGGEEYLVSRRHFVFHPRGIAFTPGSGVPAAQTPSDEELMDPSNWTRAYEPKNIRIVRFVHRI